jgi:hypothetical protein
VNCRRLGTVVLLWVEGVEPAARPTNTPMILKDMYSPFFGCPLAAEVLPGDRQRTFDPPYGYWRKDAADCAPEARKTGRTVWASVFG